MPGPVPRRVVASLAALAIAMAGLLPSAHVHLQAGDTAIHRHVIGDDAAHRGQGGNHDSSLDHDDHRAARMLSVAYDAGVPFSLHGARTVTIRPVDDAAFASARAANRATLLPTHDPPLRFICSPAPPASA